jgi:hypothetical protein
MITLYQFAPIWGIPNLSHAYVKEPTSAWSIYLMSCDPPYQRFLSASNEPRILAREGCRP